MDIAILAPVSATIHAYGSLQPQTRYSIMSQVNGTIEQIHLKPGDIAKAGETIITLSNPKLSREAEKAKLDWLTEQANLQKLQSAHLNATAEHASKVKLAGFELALAENRLKANKMVYQQQVISSLDLQQSQLAYEKARLTLDDLQQQQQTLQNSQQAELAAFRYILQRAEQQYELLQTDIRHLQIKAGIDGLVNKLNADLEEGQSIEAGFGLGQLADPLSLYAQLRVQANDINRLSQGQPVKIQVKDQTVTGVIQRISPQVDNSTVEVDVKLTTDLPPGAISNISVSATIEVQARQASVQLKKPPHVQQSGDYYVVVASAAEQQLRRISVGWVGAEHIEILTGIDPGDKVLLADPVQIGWTLDE
jgi:HlyD family secretion protein